MSDPTCVHCHGPIAWKTARDSHWTHVGTWQGKRCPNALTGATPAEVAVTPPVSDLRQRLMADDGFSDISEAAGYRADRAVKVFAAWLREQAERYLYCAIAADAIDPQPERD